ncbi:MAG: MlaD family protein [Candidatus Desulfofervidaceae bacterium]|nr:MlaD family protein [Candidatus Desulfofervidaceae bacterium]
MKEKWILIIKTAAFLVFSILLLGTVIMFLGKERQYFKRTFILKTQFKSVAGLSPESPVYRYGLQVGHVAKCDFLPDGRVEVIMRIEEKFHNQFRQGCYAKIVSVGILGDKAVDVVGGEPSAPVLAAKSVIDSVEPFSLEDIAAHVKPLLDNAAVIARNLAKITDEIRREHNTYRQIFRNIEKITEDIAQGKGTIGALLKKEELYQEMVVTIQQGREAMEKVNEIVDSMHKCSVDVPPLISQAQQAATELTALLQQMQAFLNRLDKWTVEADTILTQFSYVSKQMKTASDDIPVITHNLRTASQGAVEVIEAAKKSWFIRRYLKLPEKKEKVIKPRLYLSPEEQTPKTWKD